MSERRGARRKLADRYELAEVIGRGGMGTVYRAVDLVLGRSVAVKTLPWLVADQNPNSVARFEREARAAAALSHPDVVSIYDTGVDASTHFIVMELVAGRSLEAVIRDEGAMDCDRAVAVATRVADALAAAHRAGIIHRDIKPANVMVADDGAVKVLDFGIARALGSATLTENSAVLGTAAYMAPEQVQGKPADERSDIYALGCVLYALLAGHPPFTAGGVAAIMHQQANVDPPALGAENRRVSPALSALVMQMLAKSPEDRPGSAAEVCNRLSALSDRPRSATAATREMPPPSLPAGAADIAKAGRPTRERLAVVCALAAAILVIALVALASSGNGAPHTLAAGRHGRTASTATVAHQRSATVRSRSPSTSTVATTAASARTAAKKATAASPGATSQPGASVHPQTVAGAARAFAALISRDVQSGAIDPYAWHQLEPALTGVLDSGRAGEVASVQNQLAAVAQQMTALEQQGHIASAAAPALSAALADLTNALNAAAPAAAPNPSVAGAGAPDPHGPPGHGGVPPGHGGVPPGHDKHFGSPGGN